MVQVRCRGRARISSYSLTGPRPRCTWRTGRIWVVDPGRMCSVQLVPRGVRMEGSSKYRRWVVGARGMLGRYRALRGTRAWMTADTGLGRGTTRAVRCNFAAEHGCWSRRIQGSLREFVGRWRQHCLCCLGAVRWRGQLARHRLYLESCCVGDLIPDLNHRTRLQCVGRPVPWTG